MALINVVKRLGKKQFEIVEIDEDEDVIHIFIEDGAIQYQTVDGAIYSDISIFEEKERAQAKNPKFSKVERGHIANLSKIVYYDTVNKNAYYEPFPARKGAPFTPIGKPYEKILQESGIPFIDTEKAKSQGLFNWSNKAPRTS